MPADDPGVPAGSTPGEGDLARLAARALELVRDGDIVGLGSGRAATAFLRALAERVGEGLRVRGVPTSEATAALARRLGVPLAGLDEAPLALTVDGADEVDPRLDLIKGYGGAMVRERIVAAASRRQVILVTVEKLVPVLGTRGRLPIEIVPFALPLCRRRLEALGCPPAVRQAASRPVRSDNGNLLLDCAIRPLADPAALERELRAIPGVVDTGLFLGTAGIVFVADGRAVRILERQGRR
ncbi:MAG: ribose-5-phosphate isomerase RpiA [Candidatus Rokubacteria bacterium]|nr:ribose-5-phosphate isomerase RpiA [Candidatus Rokubacteria bacterium]